MLPTLDLRGRGRDSLLVLPRPQRDAPGPVEEVRAILRAVREDGDEAVRRFTSKFDDVDLEALRVEDKVLEGALRSLPGGLRDALEEAHGAIEAFHRHGAGPPGRYERAGVRVEHLLLPVERAGVYVPGGRARYPSSVLMTVVPAKVAGVDAVACCAPPGPQGDPPVEVLAAAAIAGVDEMYRIGGAQAIAAMAYGTESVPKVDVIVGPGNKWVSLAQREVRGEVGVPASFAGPSEVVVVADDTTPAEWAAIDVIVQAEHGPDGLAWLITWSESAAIAIAGEIERLVEASPRGAEARSTLEVGGHIVLVDGPEQAIDVANAIAPEHLELLVADAEALVPLVRHAGVIFLGPMTPASVGDYVAGPSHVLPTERTARFASVLGVEDFQRRVHAVRVDDDALAAIAPVVAAIATCEGLPAHAESVRVRVGEPTWSAP